MTMAASVQFRPQNRDLGMVMREVDKDLAIFLGMRNAEKEKGNDHLLVDESDEFADSEGTEPKPDSLLISRACLAEIGPAAHDNDFLKLEIEGSDYDWLLMQADTSLLPLDDVGAQDSTLKHSEISNGEGVSLKAELESTFEESASPCELSLQRATSNRADSFAEGNRRPSSSGHRRPAHRSATPTGQQTLPEKLKPSRASMPNSRATLPSSKPMAAQARSSTPKRGPARSSTPTSRSCVPVSSKSTARSTTPTPASMRKLTASSPASRVSFSHRSSSGRKTGSTTSKNPVSSRGTSPTVKSRPSKPSEVLTSSHDSPQNPKLSFTQRPASATRGRPTAPHLASSHGKPRQKSCSPAKLRAPPTTAQKTGSKMLLGSRGHSNDGDDVNPALMGTKMVNRVVSMRKLAPPKHDEYVSHDNPRKSSHENSGFGRSLSKTSLDMAIRHMDIGRGAADKLRPVATGALSSARGIQSGASESAKTSILESLSPPSSSCDSSKSSI